MQLKVIPENLILQPDNPDEYIEELKFEVGNLLKKTGKTISPAESCTGGLLSKVLTDIPGSSGFIECGVVSYSNRIKTELLGVPESTLEEKTAVCEDVAIQMARGVRRLSGADIGIGITGVAGPGPDGDHPEGEIYIALSSDDVTMTAALMTDTENARDYNRKITTLNALNMLKIYLQKSERKVSE